MHIPEKVEAIMKEKIKNILLKYLSYYDLIELRHPIDEYWCPYIGFLDDLEDTLFLDLIEIASFSRATLDSNLNDFTKNTKTRNAGSLIMNNEIDKSILLTFREGCNKVIHSLDAEVLLEMTTVHPGHSVGPGYDEFNDKRYKVPTLLLKGKHNGKNWEATLNVVVFLGIAGSLF